MMRILLFFVTFTLLLWSESIQQIVKEGLASDPHIRMLVKDYTIALKDVELAKANYMPTLDISGFSGREKTKTPANLGQSRIYNTENGSVDGNYNLFSGFKDKYLIKEKETAAKLAENKLKEGLIQLSKTIANAYIDVLKRYKIYKMHQTNLQNYKRTLKKVALKIKDGGGRDSDLFQTKSRMNYEETSMIMARQSYEDALTTLARYIQRTPSVKNMRTPYVNSRQLKLKRLIAKTKKYNASLGNLILEKEISTFVMEQQKSNYYPSLDFQVSKNWSQDQHGILGIDDSDKIGIHLKYNIYNGDRDAINIEKAKLQVLKAQDSIEDAKREILTALKRNYNNYIMSKKKIKSIDKHIFNAKKTEKLYIQEEEETGERSIIDILNIQQEYNAAEIDKIDTRYTAMQLYFEMIASTSEILNYFKISKK